MTIPFLRLISSGHCFPPLRAGLTMILYLNRDPVASGPAHDDQGPTIHGNGTTIQITHLIYGLVTFCLDHLI
jgi:hypothetical protein